MTSKRKVLVVDASKVVRASLAKLLSGRFDVRDEATDDSAWQTMVLDSAIVAVVSGLRLPGPDSVGLLEHLRASKLSRLNGVPFFLIVSSAFSESERQEALRSGVTGFIEKDAIDSVESIVSAHMQWREDTVEGRAPLPPVPSAPPALPDEPFEQYGSESDIGISNIMGHIAGLERADQEPPSEDAFNNTDTALAEEMLEEYLANNMPEPLDGLGVGVLAFGLDGYDGLVARYGSELPFLAAQKFCFLLSRKVRPEDYIGQLANGRVVIVTPSSSAQTCAGFANRICKAMASSQVSVNGQRIHLTVSVGVAVMPDDGATLTETGLLQLAYERLDTAMRAGGNRVVSSSNLQGTGCVSCEAFVPQLKQLMASTDPAMLNQCMGAIGMQLMPLLRELDKHFRLGLPIEEMNKRFWDRERAERLVS